MRRAPASRPDPSLPDESQPDSRQKLSTAIAFRRKWTIRVDPLGIRALRAPFSVRRNRLKRRTESANDGALKASVTPFPLPTEPAKPANQVPVERRPFGYIGQSGCQAPGPPEVAAFA